MGAPCRGELFVAFSNSGEVLAPTRKSGLPLKILQEEGECTPNISVGVFNHCSHPIFQDWSQTFPVRTLTLT